MFNGFLVSFHCACIFMSGKLCFMAQNVVCAGELGLEQKVSSTAALVAKQEGGRGSCDLPVSPACVLHKWCGFISPRSPVPSLAVEFPFSSKP